MKFWVHLRYKQYLKFAKFSSGGCETLANSLDQSRVNFLTPTALTDDDRASHSRIVSERSFVSLKFDMEGLFFNVNNGCGDI